jgi:hypothetical protein
LFLWLMLFLAPPLPIAVYLLLLGALNRSRHPILVSGTWDFVGVLFAASGFLLCGGPAVLSLLNDRWRETWLFSEPGEHAPTSPGSLFWLFLYFAYYVAVLACAAFLVRRRRRLTAVYNALPEDVEAALLQAFDRLGLHSIRTGPTYHLDPLPDVPVDKNGNKSGVIRAPSAASPGPADLEVESFPAMKHVSLCWEPADYRLRLEVERELAEQLGQRLSPRNDVGPWMTVLGLAILAITVVGGCAGLFLMLALR